MKPQLTILQFTYFPGLIHFLFFSPDDVNLGLDGGSRLRRPSGDLLQTPSGPGEALSRA